MVGSSIKKLRRQKKLTQQDLADRLGVSRQAICLWESNKREVRITVLKRMAKIFDVTIDKIIQIQEGLTMAKKKQTTSNKIRRAVFELMAPDAKRVSLAGDFNGWEKDSILMKRSRNGLWKTNVELQPGRYEYKFVVDDQWWTDPVNTQTNTNSLGTLNSVKEV